MIRKILISVIVVIILTIAGYFIFKFLSRQSSEVSPAINAVPVDACFILDIKDPESVIDKFLTDNLIWNEIDLMAPFRTFVKTVISADSILESNKEVSEMLKKGSVIISSHMTGKERFDYLISTNLPKEVGETDVLEHIKAIAGNVNVTDRQYNGATIFDVKGMEAAKSIAFSFCFQSGILIYSTSSLLVEESVSQLLASENLMSDNGFLKVQKTAGMNVDANLYINHYQFPHLSSLIANESYNRTIGGFTNYAEWTELDLAIKSDALLLNGFTSSGDSVNNFINVLADQSPQGFELENYIPATTSTFVAMGISDFKVFANRYKTYMEKDGKSKEYDQTVSSVKRDYNIDLIELFSAFFEDEAALVYTEVNGKDLDESTYTVIRTKSKSIADESLKKLTQAYLTKNGGNMNSMIQTLSIDDETTFEVCEMPFKYIGSRVFGPVFSRAETSFYTFVDNYLVFGNSPKSLERFVTSYLLQKTLNTELSYIGFRENLSARSNFYLYSNIAYSSGLLKSYVSPEVSTEIDKNQESLQKFQGFALQISADRNLFYNNIFLFCNPVFKQRPHTTWESKLEAPLVMKPCLMVNHNTQEKEIFIQDQANNIYLINSSGRILWKQKLNERIISDVYQIDYYNNKKLQFLFNTKSKIHLIDRNGNYVERYPVSLREKATNGIAVFDYESNRDYRFFIACQDKKVYAYSKEGNVIDGWEFGKSESFVYNAVQHFRFGDKDFIVFADSMRVYILDRRGKERIKPEFPFPVSRMNAFVQEGTSEKEGRIIATDTSGTVHFIDLEGKIIKLEGTKLSSRHFFLYEDIDCDGSKDFIFLDGKNLIAMDKKGKKILSYTFEAEVPLSPVVYSFSASDRKLGITIPDRSEIFLLNKNGTLYEDFPLEGSTQFSIGHVSAEGSRFNLIVGSADGFLYNYEVQ